MPIQRVGSVPSQISDGASLFDTDSLVRSAQFVSGNFAPLDAGLRARVDKLVGWINAQGPVAPWQKPQVELQLRKLLANRLRMAADRARIKQIADEPIESPIIVIGFARTGTTLMHSLLAEDPKALTPYWWHTHEPSPPPGEVPVAPYRIEMAGNELDDMLLMAPGLLSLHPYWDKRGYTPIEDEEIFTLDFHNAYPSLLYRLPTLSLVLEAGDPADAYDFHKSFLQHFQWNNRPGHWVVKGIYHQFVLDALFEAYPDACCIWPHREPAEVWPSTLAITAVLYGAITEWGMDMAALGPQFVESIDKSLAEVVKNPLVDDDRIVHVDFKNFVSDPIATIRDAYGRWGKPYTPEFEQRMRAWLADPTNRADRHGRYPYNLEPFGLTPEMLRDAFGAYRERFGIAPKSAS